MVSLKKIVSVMVFVLFTPSFVMAGGHGQKQDIVSVAAGNEAFSTLVAAVKAADLVSVLKSDGPFTVFAPTNEAFKALPKGTVENLLKPENKAKLVAVLKHHVIPGDVRSSAIKGKKLTVKTVGGTSLKVNATKGVRVGGAKVTQADLEASNGVIHVINKVLLP